MFGLRFATKRELMLFAATIEDLRHERDAFRDQAEHERKRADAAINALLVRTNKIAITPSPSPKQAAEMEQRLNEMMNIFGDDDPTDAGDILERIQHDRSE